MDGLIMNALSYPILSVTIFVPVLGALVLMLLPRRNLDATRWVALATSIIVFVLSVPLFTAFDKSTYKMQFVEKHTWIESLNVNYALGVDGISVLFVLLSTLITITCILVSWNSVKDRAKEFYVSILLIEGAMIGVFCSLDLFLFYIFWEAMLIPMFLLIGVWGGKRRVYAAIKFFLYTLVGSLLMLIGIIVLYLYADKSFDILTLSRLNYPYGMQMILFWAFFAAFAVKVPMFPMHTWLPDAHTEAPTAGSVILAAVLIKMGAYGFLRLSLPFFPDAVVALTPFMLALSVIAIIYGAVVCLAQTDLKRLIAYSSVSHMGFVTLGIFSLTINGLEGGILQMINHGIITGALFLSIGMIYERTHTRLIADYGGAASVIPMFAAFFMVFTLASIGLPGTNGFVSEFLSILGGFAARPWAGVFAATGIIIGAGYMLWLYQRIFFMEVNPRISGLSDIEGREVLCLLPLVLLVFWIGVYPNAFLGFMHASVQHLVDRLQMGSQPEMAVAENLLGLLK